MLLKCCFTSVLPCSSLTPFCLLFCHVRQYEVKKNVVGECKTLYRRTTTMEERVIENSLGLVERKKNETTDPSLMKRLWHRLTSWSTTDDTVIALAPQENT